MATADPSTRSDYYVYALFRENGVPFYIGKGREGRWQAHEQEARAGRRGHRFNVIRGMQERSLEVPKIRIHEDLTHEIALEYEIALIVAIGRRPLGPLVNRTNGGDGSKGCFPSLETRARMSAVRVGKKQRPESIEKTAAAHRGRKRSPETCERISKRALERDPRSWAHLTARNANRSREDIAKNVAAMRAGQTPESIAKSAAKNRGKKRSLETRAKIAAALLGRKQSPEHAENRVIARLAADKRRRLLKTSHI